MENKAAHILSIVGKLALCLALCFMCVGGASIIRALHPSDAYAQGEDANSDGTQGEDGEEGEEAEPEPEPVDQPKKMTLKAYPLKNDGDATWDVNAGSTKTISDNGGQLRIAVSVTWTDGDVVSEYDTISWDNKGGFASGFNYTTSSACVAVDSRGIITAKDDGSATIKVTPKNEDYSSLSASITISVSNQGEGFTVTKVTIVNENGTAYGGNGLKLTADKDNAKLYAIVTFKDKISGETKKLANYPNCPSEMVPQNGELDILNWRVSDSNYAKVSNQSKGVGYIKAVANGSIQLFCTITGGDSNTNAGFGPGVVAGKTTVSINNGKTIGGNNPAEMLTVKIIYENNPDIVASTHVYTKKQFEALGAITCTYTLTQTGGKYVTDKAYGVPIATLLKELKLDVNDVRYFTMAANDGANPGKISADWLLKTTRYYLPNFDIGGSWAEKKQVPSMLALKDSWNSNTMVTGEMNSGTCFRLVFGASGNSDGATSKSIKFINTFTIVMAGSAPSSHGDDNTTKHSSSGDGTGDGQGSGSDSQGESADGPNPETGDAGGSGKSVIALDDMDSEAKWSIYEMINKSNSDVDLVYPDDKTWMWALPTAIILFIVAGCCRFRRFKYQIM